MDEDSWLELLAIYQEMIEKQDDIIRHLGSIVARQAADLQFIKNDAEYSNVNLDKEIAITNEAQKEYKALKSQFEP